MRGSCDRDRRQRVHLRPTTGPPPRTGALACDKSKRHASRPADDDRHPLRTAHAAAHATPKAHAADEHGRRYCTETLPGRGPTEAMNGPPPPESRRRKDAACLPSRGTSSLTNEVKLRRRIVVPADHDGWGHGAARRRVARRRGRPARPRRPGAERAAKVRPVQAVRRQSAMLQGERGVDAKMGMPRKGRGSSLNPNRAGGHPHG